MYKRNTSHWFKHWDFILLDFILIEAAFYVAYVVRNQYYREMEDEEQMKAVSKMKDTRKQK